jgi:hypothetical protein
MTRCDGGFATFSRSRRGTLEDLLPTIKAVLLELERRFAERVKRNAWLDLVTGNYACFDEITEMREARVREIASEFGYSEFLDIPQGCWRLRYAYDDEIKRHVMHKYSFTEIVANTLLNVRTRGG